MTCGLPLSEAMTPRKLAAVLAELAELPEEQQDLLISSTADWDLVHEVAVPDVIDIDGRMVVELS